MSRTARAKLPVLPAPRVVPYLVLVVEQPPEPGGGENTWGVPVIASHRKELRTATFGLWGVYAADLAATSITGRGLPAKATIGLAVGAGVATLGWLAACYLERLDERVNAALVAKEAEGFLGGIQLSQDIATGAAVRKPKPQHTPGSVTSLRDYPQTS